MNPLCLERYSHEEYGDFFYNLFKKEENREFFRRVPIAYKKEDLARYEAEYGCQLFAVLHHEKCIGFVGIAQFCNYGLTCHAGIILDANYQDIEVNTRKFCFWSILALAQLLFRNTVTRKFYLRFLSHREDLERTCIKAGFAKEGYWKESVHHKGKYCDEVEYTFDKELYLDRYGDL